MSNKLTPERSGADADAILIRSYRSADLDGVMRLATRSLGWADNDAFRAFFQWKHIDNAFGRSLLLVAEDETHGIVGLRAFMQWELSIDGRPLAVARAVDTATDPVARGKGLFTRLTLHGLECLPSMGIAAVFNTPNEKSLPGYLKMGWVHAGTASVSVLPRSPLAIGRVLRSRVPAELWSVRCSIGEAAADALLDTTLASRFVVDARDVGTRWTAERLRWRYGLDRLNYRTASGYGAAAIFRLRERGHVTELVMAESSAPSPQAMLRLGHRMLRDTGADVLVAAHGAIPGVTRPAPTLAWRQVSESSPAAPTSWALSAGSMELM